mgnify:CR=1 FL=1
MELRTKASRFDAVTERERENLQVAYRAAFAKTAQLEPGQTEELELTFDLRELSSYRERDGAFILDSGDYVLRLGDSSRNTCPVAVLALEKETVVSWHAGICPVQEHMHLQELQAPARARRRSWNPACPGSFWIAPLLRQCGQVDLRFRDPEGVYRVSKMVVFLTGAMATTQAN